MTWLLVLAAVAVLLAIAVARRRTRTDLPGATRSQGEVEDAIRKLVRSQGPRPVGEIRAQAQPGGVIGFRGAVEVGDGTRRAVDFASPAFQAANAGKPGLVELLDELRAATDAGPDGPWYYLIITARADGEITFDPFPERTPLASIADLRLDPCDYVPAHVYRQRFDPVLVAELPDFEVNAGIAGHVPDRIAAGRPVSLALLELFATLDWEGDVNNGGMDQYFARRHSDTTGAPRRDYYPLVHAGLRRIGADDAAALFAESVALYAHLHPDVEQARGTMGIAAVPRRENSDIGARYYLVQPELNRLRAAYVRAHPEILEGAPEP